MKFLKILFFIILLKTFSFSEEINLTPPDKEVKVSIGEPLILSFKLPPVKSAKLYFLTRAGDETLEKPAGYSDALIIEINDRKITDPSKLINKKQIFRLKGKPEKEISWYQNNTWMVPISPDYTSVDSHYLYAIENTKACEFIFDITDFVGEENNLKFIRLPRPWSKIPLYFKNVKIIYEKGEDKKVESKKEEISIKIANEEKIPADEIRILTLPVKEKNKNVYLKISVRRDSERLGGYGHYMQILVNDKFVDASIDRKNKRLINKSLSFKRPDGSQTFWNLGDGIYLTFFSPDFKTDVSMYGVLEPDPYTYILDITDLLNEKGINQLYIKNLYSKSHEQQYNRELSLFVNVEVIIKEGEEKKIDTEKIEIKGKPEMEITNKGAIKLNFENTSIILESLFSYPDDGFNKLGEEGSEDEEKEWKVEIKKNTKKEGEIFAKGKFYSINRKIKLKETSILVEDEITNLTSEDMGIIFSNHINFKDIPLYYARIGGRTSQSLNNIINPQNPTIFYPMKNSGIGIVANDDVYRNQGILFYDLDKKITGIKDENFCLGPKKSYKISWSLYFLNSDDYYEFINLVRNDWGSNNITIDGPFYFINYDGIVGSTEDGLKKLIESKNAKYIVFWEVRTPNPLSEYDNRKVVAMGTGILNPIFNEELKKVKLAVEKLKKISSDLKVSLYTHSFFISPEKADDTKYKDSWIVDREGKRAVSQYNTKDYYNYQPVFPTLTNSYGKDYLKLIIRVKKGILFTDK